MIHKQAYKHEGKRMIESPVTGSYLFANELLPQELAGLKHVGDVVEWTETFVFVLGLLLSRENRRWRSVLGTGREDEWKEGHGSRKLFTHPVQMQTRNHTHSHTHKKKPLPPLYQYRRTDSHTVGLLVPSFPSTAVRWQEGSGLVWTAAVHTSSGRTHKDKRCQYRYVVHAEKKNKT